MLASTFFVCPNCGNVKNFRVFTSNFQVVKQSPEMGVRVDESDVMPSLRENDNYIECQRCFKRVEYDRAVDIGQKYIQVTRKFRK